MRLTSSNRLRMMVAACIVMDSAARDYENEIIRKEARISIDFKKKVKSKRDGNDMPFWANNWKTRR